LVDVNKYLLNGTNTPGGDDLHLEEQTLTIQEKLLPALRGLELVASGGVFDKDEIGGKNGEARRFLGWTTERHWVLGPNREDDPGTRQ